ncbi:MAG TPA: biotin transporter BioY [Vicinamibacterales bacterium]|nr:biotin transporter BioY [Vicinamibacterales bacterium]
MIVQASSSPGASAGSLLTHAAGQSDYRVLARAAGVLLAVALTAAAAQCSSPLPFTSVPFTLTPLAVMLTGAALGSRLGFVAQALYLAAGAAGLAVFTPSITLPPGAARLVGPSGGYLLAYPVAAFITGWLAERGWDRRYLSSLASMLIGLAVIFAGGVSWLSLMPGQTPGSALAQGFLPFIALDIVKAAIAAKILPLTWTLLAKDK